MAQQAQQPTITRISITYGHTDTQVVVQFSHPIPNLMLTPAEAKKFRESIENMERELERHQQALQGGKPNG